VLYFENAAVRVVRDAMDGFVFEVEGSNHTTRTRRA
jgi:hypothetical protein